MNGPQRHRLRGTSAKSNMITPSDFKYGYRRDLSPAIDGKWRSWRDTCQERGREGDPAGLESSLMRAEAGKEAQDRLELPRAIPHDKCE